MMQELRQAIMSRLQGLANVSGHVFYTAADKEYSDYVVFSLVTSTGSRDSVNEFEDVYVQFSCYSENTSADKVDATAKDLRAKFDNCEALLQLPSYYTCRVDYQFTRATKIEKVFQTIIQYKISLQKK